MFCAREIAGKDRQLANLIYLVIGWMP